jgi:hypothetical protein
MYMGILQEIQLQLLHGPGCERYPYLEMEETCANDNLFNVILISDLKMYNLNQSYSVLLYNNTHFLQMI